MKSINYKNLFIITSLLIPFLFSCSNKRQETFSSICSREEFKCLQSDKLVEIITNRGRMVLELNGEDAPLTAGNFLDLVRKGVYNNTRFHRVIKKPTPFIAQGGNPLSTDFNLSMSNLSRGSYIDPNTGQRRFIPLEIRLRNEDHPRYNQLIKDTSQISQIKLRHKRGSIAMARLEPVSSASSQFYFSLKALPELDGRYAVFGKIVNGIEVLDFLKQGDSITRIKIINSN